MYIHTHTHIAANTTSYRIKSSGSYISSVELFIERMHMRALLQGQTTFLRFSKRFGQLPLANTHQNLGGC